MDGQTNKIFEVINKFNEKIKQENAPVPIITSIPTGWLLADPKQLTEALQSYYDRYSIEYNETPEGDKPLSVLGDSGIVLTDDENEAG